MNRSSFMLPPIVCGYTTSKRLLTQWFLPPIVGYIKQRNGDKQMSELCRLSSEELRHDEEQQKREEVFQILPKDSGSLDRMFDCDDYLVDAVVSNGNMQKLRDIRTAIPHDVKEFDDLLSKDCKHMTAIARAAIEFINGIEGYLAENSEEE